METPSIEAIANANSQPLSPEAQAFEDKSWQEINTDTRFVHKDVLVILSLTTAKIKAARKNPHWKAESIQYLKDLRKLFLNHERAIRENKVDEVRLKMILDDLNSVAMAAG